MEVAEKHPCVGGHLAQKPRHTCQQNHGDGGQARNRSQRLLLQAGQGLHQAEEETQQDRGNQERRGQNQGFLHHLAKQLGNQVGRHWFRLIIRFPQKLFISEFASRFQPSTITKSRILSGVETTTGGSWNMPIEVVMEAVTISMSRKGRNSTAPMAKPAFNSESM